MVDDYLTIEYWVSHLEWIEVTDKTGAIVLVAILAAIAVTLPVLLTVWCNILVLGGCTRRVRRLRRAKPFMEDAVHVEMRPMGDAVVLASSEDVDDP